jgi:hypothetical protein
LAPGLTYLSSHPSVSRYGERGSSWSSSGQVLPATLLHTASVLTQPLGRTQVSSAATHLYLQGTQSSCPSCPAPIHQACSNCTLSFPRTSTWWSSPLHAEQPSLSMANIEMHPLGFSPGAGNKPRTLHIPDQCLPTDWHPSPNLLLGGAGIWR